MRQEILKISKNFAAVGVFLVVLNALLVVGRSITEITAFGITSTLLIAGFSFYHGSKRFGWKRMLFFLGMITVVSWSYETLSILTGFPFGHYHYNLELLPPAVGLVPAIIMPAYFAMGYLSFVIASILLDKRDSGIKGSEIILLPTIASFVMVMWDICMDPNNSTISGFWTWHNGGAYFGVPFVNFLGWFLCVFTFYLIFVLFLRWTDKKKESSVVVLSKAFWILPPLLYVSRAIEYFGNIFLKESVEVMSPEGHVWWTGDIYGSLALMSIFTMIFVSFYAVVRVLRSNDLQK